MNIDSNFFWEKLSLLLRKLKVSILNWKVTACNMCLLLLGVSLLTTSFVSYYSPKKGFSLGRTLDWTAEETNNAQDAVDFIGGVVHEILKSPPTLQALEDFEVRVMAQSNSTVVSEEECTSQGMVSCFKSSQGEFFRNVKTFVKTPPMVLSKQTPQRKMRFNKDGFSVATVDYLTDKGWLSDDMKNGIVILSMVFRPEILLDDEFSSQNWFFFLGQGSELITYQKRNFMATLSKFQMYIDLGSVVVFGLYFLLFSAKFLISLNIFFSQAALLHGIFSIALIVFSMTVSVMKYKILNDYYSSEEQAPSWEVLRQLQYVYDLFRLDFFFLILYLGNEVIRILIWTRKFKNLRMALMIYKRTQGTFVKLALFLLVLVIFKEYALLDYDGLLGLQGYFDLLFKYSDVETNPYSNFSRTVAAGRRAFELLAEVILVAVVFVSFDNAQNFE